MELQSEIDVGNTVVCDMCNADFTNSDKQGGFLFGSKGVCPDCQDRVMSDIKKYNEEYYIKGYCPEGMSFKDWILKLRNGDNKIRFYSN